MTLFRSSIMLALCVLVATICISRKLNAYELHVNWQRGHMTAALVKNTDRNSMSHVRLASPSEYRYFRTELPSFYSEITTNDERQSNSTLTLASPFVRNPSIFDLLFVEQSSGSERFFGYMVSLDDNRTTVQELSINDDVISELTREPQHVARAKRITTRAVSSEIQNLLDQVYSRQSGNQYQPYEARTEPLGQKESEVFDEVEDNIFATAQKIVELQDTPQPDATMSIITESSTNLRPPAVGSTPNVVSPDFVLNAAIVASDLSHFKTVFVIASFFVFFLGLSMAVMFVIRSYSQAGNTAPQQFATRADSRAAEKILELQSAQLTRVIDVLAEGYRFPHSQIHTAISAAEDIKPHNLNNAQDAADPNTTSNISKTSTGREVPSPAKPIVNPVNQGKISTTNAPPPPVYISPEQLQKSEVKEEVSNPSELTVNSQEGANPDLLDMNFQQKKSEKLDLISVYRDMGDLHMARSLARDLTKSGSEVEKVAAQKILDELK